MMFRSRGKADEEMRPLRTIGVHVDGGINRRQLSGGAQLSSF